MDTYLVAAIKPWNIEAFHRYSPRIPGNWHLVTERRDLTPERIEALSPRYVFFPHWSWKVPASVFTKTECVLFHMTDLPYGRGGTPLQNLILSGHQETKLSAVRMIEELDAGPIYAKRPLSLAGRAEEIYQACASLVWEIIADIVANHPTPVPQTGEPVLFKRRTPEQSELPAESSAEGLYDFIRMLDAPTYPGAYLDHGAFRLEFRDAAVDDDETVRASVIIRRKP